MAPAAIWSRNQRVLSSKRKIWATPRSRLAEREAAIILRTSPAFMAMGFSQSTGLPWDSAVSVSCRCRASGEVTRTASTSGEAQRSATESKANGILYRAAEERAFSRFRRCSAVTLHCFARAKPGIKRRSPWRPKPTIPKRIMRAVSFASASKLGLPNRRVYNRSHEFDTRESGSCDRRRSAAGASKRAGTGQSWGRSGDYLPRIGHRRVADGGEAESLGVEGVGASLRRDQRSQRQEHDRECPRAARPPRHPRQQRGEL